MRILSGECICVRYMAEGITSIECKLSTVLAKKEIPLLSFGEIMDAFEAQFYLDPPVGMKGEPMSIERIELCYTGEALADADLDPNEPILKRKMRPTWVFTSTYAGDSNYRKHYFLDAETGEMIFTGG